MQDPSPFALDPGISAVAAAVGAALVAGVSGVLVALIGLIGTKKSKDTDSVADQLLAAQRREEALAHDNEHLRDENRDLRGENRQLAALQQAPFRRAVAALFPENNLDELPPADLEQEASDGEEHQHYRPHPRT